MTTPGANPTDLVERIRTKARVFADIEHERQVRERGEILAAISQVDEKIVEHVRGHARMSWLQSAVVVAALSALGTVGAKWIEASAVTRASGVASLAAQDGVYRQLAEDVRHVESRLSARLVETDAIARAVADEVERRERMRPIMATAKRR
jgi:uncharacterized protein YsxB (DUF464 family)